MGMRFEKKDIIELVGKYVRTNKIKIPFKNGMPDEDWILLFKKRYRLCFKKPQRLGYSRKKANDPFVIEGDFDIPKETLEKHKLQNKLRLIYNLDEVKPKWLVRKTSQLLG